jgi:hypothetical protein
MPPLNLLSWEFWVEAVGFWAKDSESLSRLALIVAGVIGIPLLYSRTRSVNRSARAALEQAKVAAAQAKTAAKRHDEQTRADRERRITESFAKAGEQLGSDKLETRLVGIYTLERISQESDREYWPIIETLTAFVREHAPWPPKQAFAHPFVELQGGIAVGESTPAEKQEAEKPENESEQPTFWTKTRTVAPATMDIQAVLTVLGRRSAEARKQDEAAKRRLNLIGTNLRRTNLEGATLERAMLWEANLQGANLKKACLQGAELWGARLDALLVEADLRGARLNEAHLVGAYLQDAYLQDAWLHRAHLEGANLDGAVGLTQEQLDQAFGDDRTFLPWGTGLTQPAHWPTATPDEQPPEADSPES